MSSRTSANISQATDRRRVVFVVLGPKKSKDERRESIADRVRSDFEAAGWVVRNIRPKSLGSLPGSGARPAVVLEPTDAHAIYIEAHRSFVAVVQIAAASVLKNPRSRVTPRNTMTLERFVRYKAYFIVASPEHLIDGIVMVADKWVKAVGCSGDNDPRCLPLHVFSPERDWVGLESSTVEFDKHHGKANRRKDSELRRWPTDPSNHGQQIDVVAGHRMQRGFHWDTQALRNETFIYNAQEVWAIGKRGHLNIYPDSNARPGKNSRITFRAQRPSEVLEEAGPTGKPTGRTSGRPQPSKRPRRRR